jgi:hypothetical protein
MFQFDARLSGNRGAALKAWRCPNPNSPRLRTQNVGRK